MIETQQVFTNIFNTNGFQGVESKSGRGSGTAETHAIRTELPQIFKKHSIKTIIDIPCGDFFWMPKLLSNIEYDKYYGGDIVEYMIQTNQLLHANNKNQFFVIDVCENELPYTSDVILCRDLLVHLPFAMAKKAIQNFKKSKSKFLLCTSFTDKKRINTEIAVGEWRALNLTKAPFNFPPPMEIINENCREGNNKFADKSLCLWNMNELPD